MEEKNPPKERKPEKTKTTSSASEMLLKRTPTPYPPSHYSGVVRQTPETKPEKTKATSSASEKLLKPSRVVWQTPVAKPEKSKATSSASKKLQDRVPTGYPQRVSQTPVETNPEHPNPVMAMSGSPPGRMRRSLAFKFSPGGEAEEELVGALFEEEQPEEPKEHEEE